MLYCLSKGVETFQLNRRAKLASCHYRAARCWLQAVDGNKSHVVSLSITSSCTQGHGGPRAYSSWGECRVTPQTSSQFFATKNDKQPFTPAFTPVTNLEFQVGHAAHVFWNVGWTWIEPTHKENVWPSKVQVIIQQALNGMTLKQLQSCSSFYWQGTDSCSDN